jgi:hypothetical protein
MYNSVTLVRGAGSGKVAGEQPARLLASGQGWTAGELAHASAASPPLVAQVPLEGESGTREEDERTELPLGPR